jgi:hypothetical protein
MRSIIRNRQGNYAKAQIQFSFDVRYPFIVSHFQFQSLASRVVASSWLRRWVSSAGQFAVHPKRQDVARRDLDTRRIICAGELGVSQLNSHLLRAPPYKRNRRLRAWHRRECPNYSVQWHQRCSCRRHNTSWFAHRASTPCRNRTSIPQ